MEENKKVEVIERLERMGYLVNNRLIPGSLVVIFSGNNGANVSIAFSNETINDFNGDVVDIIVARINDLIKRVL